MKYILGVDGGGTKTLAAVSDSKGNVLGIARSGPSNFQGIGTTRAGINLKEAIDFALEMGKVKASKLDFAVYGIAGADRDEDFEIVHSYVEPANYAPNYMVTNDTTIALRAGTIDGVGVALIAGTGSNTIGFSSDYRHKKVGGLGPLTGDYGSAGDLARKGIIASMKYFDGRSQKTMMYEMFCRALKLEKLEDIIEFSYIDKFIPLGIHTLAPLVFEAAGKGDRVAVNILKKTGRQVGHEAVTCIKALFKKNDKITVVLGGSVFQKGEDSTMIATMSEYIKKRYKNVEIIKLQNEPCFGALLWGSDCLRDKVTPMTVRKKMGASFKRAFKSMENEK